jgi:hypothetical protein
MSAISPPRPPHHVGFDSRKTGRACVPLTRYTDRDGFLREVICCLGAGGSKLVIDRLAGTRADQRLIAHLAADEPAQNANIVTSLYLAHEQNRRCRRLTREDLETDLFTADETQLVSGSKDVPPTDSVPLLDRHGYIYRLQAASTDMSIPELRWHRCPQHDQDGRVETVSVREAVGSLESYEPVRGITSQALATHTCEEAGISVAVLRAELARVDRSPIVLNRGLREAVLTAVKERGLSMSEIAMRCGRLKRDTRGNVSGETSWLARRIGRLPEGGESTPTPWIYSETLALISRQGLRITPREVELG